MPIRAYRADDAQTLVDLWERSVRATHDFLTEADIARLRGELAQAYLPAMHELWVLEEPENGGAPPAGFIGLVGDKVEMLFVEPERRGQGVGTRLLDHVRQGRAALSLDVNEQNPAARGFYRHYGFRELGRSALDDAGRPFPLIHMVL